jgi:mRNA-degrading endonuclease RelE of RelBE toxin-antitoxin system
VRDFDTLAGDPFSRAVDVKKLQPKSASEFRLRVGRWRALFVLDREASTIQVLRIDDRRDAY